MKKIDKISKKIKGNLRKNISLKKYNTWKVGGKAEYFFEPEDLEDLKIFLNLTSGEKVTFLGNGSNVLIRDNGIEGYVVCLKKSFNNHHINSENKFIFEAGLSCMKIAQISAKQNFTGLEFLCGIPGTLGGALKMNAGCYGGNIWDNVSDITLINKEGDLIKRKKNDFKISYRNVDIDENNFFVSASFNLQKNQMNNSLNIIKDFLKDRRSNQPTGLPSCGSVFKNPKNHHAAKILDSLGLKGFRVGGAYVSEKHANFIITEKSAKSKDIEKLINYIQKKVYEDKKISLETEVKFIGTE